MTSFNLSHFMPSPSRLQSFEIHTYNYRKTLEYNEKQQYKYTKYCCSICIININFNYSFVYVKFIKYVFLFSLKNLHIFKNIYI